MFEKEKKQYEEDSKKYERPWELWEYKIIGRDAYTDAAHHPHWLSGYHYRRKQTTFMPEYYSGLNWRVAEHLIGKPVECTNNPDSGWYVGTLKQVSKNEVIAHFGVLSDGGFDFFVYIRTCEETVKHPTINIGGVELPMPETVEPRYGECYWISISYSPIDVSSIEHCDHCKIRYQQCWDGDDSDISFLKAGRVHLTEERAKAWTRWWKNAVIDKMK